MPGRSAFRGGPIGKTEEATSGAPEVNKGGGRGRDPGLRPTAASLPRLNWREVRPADPPAPGPLPLGRRRMAPRPPSLPPCRRETRAAWRMSLSERPPPFCPGSPPGEPRAAIFNLLRLRAGGRAGGRTGGPAGRGAGLQRPDAAARDRGWGRGGCQGHRSQDKGHVGDAAYGSRARRLPAARGPSNPGLPPSRRTKRRPTRGPGPALGARPAPGPGGAHNGRKWRLRRRRGWGKASLGSPCLGRPHLAGREPVAPLRVAASAASPLTAGFGAGKTVDGPTEQRRGRGGLRRGHGKAP